MVYHSAAARRHRVALWGLLISGLGLLTEQPASHADSPLRVRRDLPAMTARQTPLAVEMREPFRPADGLPHTQVTSLALLSDGVVYAATLDGVARCDAAASDGAAGRPAGMWQRLTTWSGVSYVARQSDRQALVVDRQGLWAVDDQTTTQVCPLPRGITPEKIRGIAAGFGQTALITETGLFALAAGKLQPLPSITPAAEGTTQVRQMAWTRDGSAVVAADTGLFEWHRLATRGSDSQQLAGWQAIYPHQGHLSWAPREVGAVVVDSQDRLWFGSRQGIGCRTGQQWQLYPAETIPYNDFTGAATAPMPSTADPAVVDPAAAHRATLQASPVQNPSPIWFGTRQGAIRFAGQVWEYRMAPRWLPDNDVRAIAVAPDGTAWLGTSRGVGVIRRETRTLAEKAAFFEQEIDRYHRRTPFGYVMSVTMGTPGDESTYRQSDSDNDGLWSAMYGAGECFAYAATNDPQAKRRADDIFRALQFLSEVTQGGSHPAPPGFPARSILPTDGPDPNLHDNEARDLRMQKHDPLWKVIAPRWPVSADGKWYWKTDTSSDELDGHYFFYALYYDLVAETDEEKAAVRRLVTGLTDHLLQHNFQLYDHDGKPTRWGRFSPGALNGGVLDGARGLNSLSILSYLRAAAHITGEKRYVTAAEDLMKVHAYDVNLLDTKRRNGPGAGNQSDDEMAFMCFYNLLNYEPEGPLRQKALWALRWYWLLEEPEKSPLFNFLYAALDQGQSLEELPTPSLHTVLADGVDTLQRIPWDRVRWGFDHRHRTDLVHLPNWSYRSHPGGYLRNGSVIPIDERDLEFWNHDPWTLVAGADGRTLTDGASFLLPYYLGLYLGVITP